VVKGRMELVRWRKVSLDDWGRGGIAGRGRCLPRPRIGVEVTVVIRRRSVVVKMVVVVVVIVEVSSGAKPGIRVKGGRKKRNKSGSFM
ncbi:hypothetical protein Tco_1036694, partial [Tanacetum coccineum]